MTGRQGDRQRTLDKLVGFGRACAHPSFWAHGQAKRGAARPPPIAASLLLIRSPKIDIKKLSNLGRPRDRLFSIQWTTETMKYEVLCPRPAHRSFVYPSGNRGKRVLFLCWQNTYRPFWGVFRGGQAFFYPFGVKIMYRCDHAYALNLRVLSFFLFPIVILFFYIFILINFSYSSLLIFLVLFSLFLFFSSYI